MAIYTMSVWPTMVNQVSACPPGRTLALANIAYITQVLFLVWTVAFNFVPGGVYTREHTDWLILIVMGFIFLGLRSGEFLFGGWCVSFFFIFLFFFLHFVVPLGISPMGNSGRFLQEKPAATTQP